MTSVEDAVLRTLAYSDIFQRPLTAKEIIHRLISPRAYSSREVTHAIRALVRQRVVEKRADVFGLAGRRTLFEKRLKRTAISAQKRARASRAVSTMRWLPFVWAIYITGSVAWENARPEDDLDVLVITAPGRLWIARPFVWGLLALFQKRRKPASRQVGDLICANLFLAADQLTLPKTRRNVFTAMEVVGARLIWARSFVGPQPLIAANSWVSVFLSHQPVPAETIIFPAGKGKRWDLAWLNGCLYRVQSWYMRRRRTTEATSLGQAFFHPQDAAVWVKREYYRRLRQLGISPIIWTQQDQERQG